MNSSNKQFKNIKSINKTQSYECDSSTEEDVNNEQLELYLYSNSNKNQLVVIERKQLQNQPILSNYKGFQIKKNIQTSSIKLKEIQVSPSCQNEKLINFLKIIMLVLLLTLFILYLNNILKFTLGDEIKSSQYKKNNGKIYNLMMQVDKKISIKNQNQQNNIIHSPNFINQHQSTINQHKNINLNRYNKLKKENKLLKQLLNIQLIYQQQLLENYNQKQKQYYQNNLNLNQSNSKIIKLQNEESQQTDKLSQITSNKSKNQSLDTDQNNKLKEVKKKYSTQQIQQRRIQKLRKAIQQNQKVKIKNIDELIKQSNSAIRKKIQQNQSKQGSNTAINPNKHSNNQSITSQIKTEIIPAKNQTACIDYISKKLQKYGMLYQPSVQFQQFKINSNSGVFSVNSPTQLTRSQFDQSVELIDLIHRIDQKGNLNVEQNPCQSSQSVRKRLTEAMLSQKNRLNQLYQMDDYHSKQLRFCIVVNTYNNAHNGLMYRNIDSILQQNYTNYHVIYTEDHSPDNNGLLAKQYVQSKNSSSKFKFNLNKEKVGMMKNIYNSISKDCRMGQIVVMLDGDDSFIGTNVLSFLNAAYQKYKVAIMWNNFDCIFSNYRASAGFSSDFPKHQKQKNSFRITAGFLSSHLKSFYVDLFRKIKVKDLQHQDGNFFGGASDLATMYPMIQMANNYQSPKFKYVPEILYEYRYDTGQIGMITNRQSQARANQKIQQTRAYTPLNLSQFSFIEESIKIALLI